MKKIAVINDISGFGRCSLTAAIPIISALGVQCCPLVTAVLSNQTGYNSYYCKDLTDDMPKIIDEWKKLNADFSAVLTGFISSARQGKIISSFCNANKSENAIIVADPVMGDDGEIYKSFSGNMIKEIANIALNADIITPNLTELCILSGEDYNKTINLPYQKMIEKINDICISLASRKEKSIVVSGIKINDKIINFVFEKGDFDIIETKAIGKSFSGTGDIMAAFITARIINNIPLKQAVFESANFILKAIEATCESDNISSYNRNDGIYFEKILPDLAKFN
ncbi:MAG: pyridoxamine kinase [Clostridiales bacterium]|nr:pyridoxamine kinase [Clostridiales bacterium]